MNKEKIPIVMSEFKHHTLKTSSGKPVTKRKQAIAIALSEARKYGDDVDITKPHIRKLITEERNTMKLYDRYGFRKQAKQEGQHSRFFIGLLKKRI